MGDASNVEPLRACSRCGRAKTADQFGTARGSRGAARRASQCLACERDRRREGERLRAEPLSVPAVNRAVDSAPDPSPARRLRAELRAARDAGRSFTAAWPAAVSAALRGMPLREATDWRRSFAAMRPVWAASYSRQPWPANLTPALLPPDEHDAEAA
jgi:hypothetical protein